MTHVQTEVPEDDYERLRTIAAERGLTIRDALREATELWLDEQDAVDPTDPLFTSVESVRNAASRRDRPQTDVRDEADLVEDWDGDPSASHLGDPDQ